MTEIAIRQPSAITPAGIDFTEEQVEVITKTIAKGATPVEISLFLAICRRTGLDPFLKQIHLIPRRANVNNQWVTTYQPMVGIDGMRLTADRTGKYAGQDPIEWLDADGAWSEVWTGKGEHPIAARCSVYRKDWGRKATAVARWDSYAQYVGNPARLTSQWEKMGDVMIGKCAESLCLRRAFPAEMSGLASQIGGDFDSSMAQVVEAEVQPLPAIAEARAESVGRVQEYIEAHPETNSTLIDPEDLPFDFEPENTPATDVDLRVVATEPPAKPKATPRASTQSTRAPSDPDAKPPEGWQPSQVVVCEHVATQDELSGRVVCAKCHVILE